MGRQEKFATCKHLESLSLLLQTKTCLSVVSPLLITFWATWSCDMCLGSWVTWSCVIMTCATNVLSICVVCSVEVRGNVIDNTFRYVLWY